jgi:hypothetical protein
MANNIRGSRKGKHPNDDCDIKQGTQWPKLSTQGESLEAPFAFHSGIGRGTKKYRPISVAKFAADAAGLS